MISIVIPTKDRPDFLIRTLKYYADVGFEGHIFVGDSSNEENLRKAKKGIDRYCPNLKLLHKSCPELGVYEAIGSFANEIATPYVNIAYDDDFLVPATLAKCAAFLDRNKDYTAAYGAIQIHLAVRGYESFGFHIIEMRKRKRPASLEDPIPSQRLFNCFDPNEGWLAYIVIRREIWQLMYSCSLNTRFRLFSEDYLPRSLLVCRGKVKSFDDDFHSIVQVHNQQAGYIVGLTGILADSEEEEACQWFAAFNAYCRRVAAELVEEEGIEFEQAMQVVKQAILRNHSKHLSDWVKRKFEKPSLTDLLMARVNRRKRSLQTFINRQLFSKSFGKYYKDFHPIHQALSSIPEF